MRRTLSVLALSAALPVMSGCAASSNLFGKDPCKVYGGTQLDATLISEGFTPDPKVVKDNKLEHPVLVYEGWCGIIDMPLSFVVDTVTLPITAPLALARSSRETETEESTAKKERAAAPAD